MCISKKDIIKEEFVIQHRRVVTSRMGSKTYRWWIYPWKNAFMHLFSIL
jgi:hypothetical protein